jgi:hypothetical protein
MSDHLYNESVKIWAARTVGSGIFWAEDIDKIEFGEGNYGYCETCDDPYSSIEITYTRNGKTKKVDFDLSHITPTQLVKECMDIYLTLYHKEYLKT